MLKLIKTGIDYLVSVPCSSLLKVKFWLILSGYTPSLDIRDELLKHAKKIKAPIAKNIVISRRSLFGRLL